MSMTPSTVSLVLVEGHDADGVTIDHESFSVQADSGQQAATAVVRTESTAANQGHRLRVIGVTWTADADSEATVLLKTLADAGFDNVIPVRLPQATEALARGIADVVGYETTAVCVVEGDAAYAYMVNPARGSIQTAVNHAIAGAGALIDWLGMVFATTNRRPDALVVVGPDDDLDAMLPELQSALDVPVFTPAEADQPLARGAALASIRRGRFVAAEPGSGARSVRKKPARMAPVALLAGGVVTFVGSLSLAISLQISPDREPTPKPPRPVSNTSGSPVAVQHAPPPVVIPPAPPEPESDEAAQFVVEPPVSEPATAPQSGVFNQMPAVVPAAPEIGTDPHAEQVVPPPVDGATAEAPVVAPVPEPGVAGPHEIQQQVL
ncbi:hypothetical protein, partial [Mycolicibacterium sp.]|uniref:DUF7159 family protein n=1 Tax=Mycolicibacterium sp. TaxID=2320850 RepID=UPI0037C5A2C4